MTSRIIIAAIAVAAVAATAARAEDLSQYTVQFKSSRTRAEVQAEAATVPAAGRVYVGWRAPAPVQSSIDAKQVRTQAAEALRQGLIPHGEAG